MGREEARLVGEHLQTGRSSGHGEENLLVRLSAPDSGVHFTLTLRNWMRPSRTQLRTSWRNS
jgi:hypothetical protein